MSNEIYVKVKHLRDRYITISGKDLSDFSLSDTDYNNHYELLALFDEILWDLKRVGYDTLEEVKVDIAILDFDMRHIHHSGNVDYNMLHEMELLRKRKLELENALRRAER